MLHVRTRSSSASSLAYSSGSCPNLGTPSTGGSTFASTSNSRKRKSTSTELSIRHGWSKRKRERFSQGFSESSCDSLFSSKSLSNLSKEDVIEQKCNEIAKKYNINIRTARKHFDIFEKQLYIKAEPIEKQIKKEVHSPEYLTLPVANLRNRKGQFQSQTVHNPSKLSRSPNKVVNHFNYTNVSIKKEWISPERYTVNIKQEVVSPESEPYYKKDYNKPVVSKESTSKIKQKCKLTWLKEEKSSGDEFENPLQSQTNKLIVEKELDSPKVVTNPFSKHKKKNKTYKSIVNSSKTLSPCKSTKKKSKTQGCDIINLEQKETDMKSFKIKPENEFITDDIQTESNSNKVIPPIKIKWNKEIFSVDTPDRLLKKEKKHKKTYKSDKKYKKRKSFTENNMNDYENCSIAQFKNLELYRKIKEKNLLASKNMDGNNTYSKSFNSLSAIPEFNKKIRKKRSFISKSISSNDPYVESIDSLSVNCKKVKVVDEMPKKEINTKRPLSFGGICSDDENEDKKDGSDIVLDSDENDEVKESITTEEQNNLNNRFSFHCESYTKSDSDKIDLESQSPTREIIGKANKPKSKPIMKSNVNLSKFKYIKIIPKSNDCIDEVEIQSPSKFAVKSNTVKGECNGTNETPITTPPMSLSTSPIFSSSRLRPNKLNSRTRSVQKSQMDNEQNLSSSTNVNEQVTPEKLTNPKPGPNSKNNNVVNISNQFMDETFDELCLDVDLMSQDVNMLTLYNGDEQVADGCKEKVEKVVIRLSDDKSDNADAQASAIVNRAAEEVDRILHGRPSSDLISKIPRIPKIKRLSLNTSSTTVGFVKPVQSSVSSAEQQTQQTTCHSPVESQPRPLAGPRAAVTSAAPSLQSSQIRYPSPTLSSRDPRLNRSISPAKTPSSDSRDPRLNRSIPSNASGTDNSNSTTLGTLAKEADTSTNNLIEKSEKKSRDEEITTESNSTSTIFATPQSIGCSQTPKKKQSVFNRLGTRSSKTPLPNATSEINEFYSIIKEKPNRHRNSTCESDDDGLSLHFAGELTDFEEDEPSATPRHNKFTAEREDIDEVLNYKPNEKTGRYTRWNQNNSFVNPNTVSNSTRPMINFETSTPTMPRQLVSNPASLLNSQSLYQPKINPTQFPMKEMPQATVAAPSKVSLNDSNKSSLDFNSFLKLNEVQMSKDEANFRTQQLEKNDNQYVTFDGKNTVGKCDNVWMLDTLAPPPPIGLPDAKTTFFRGYCYQKLRFGNCKNENICCYFNHRINDLKNLIKHKNAKLLYSILDCVITNKFVKFLIEIWKIILPNLGDYIFPTFEKIYKANIREDTLVDEMLRYHLETKQSPESFVKQISTIIKDDSKMVNLVCRLIKSKLPDGFCWETIKDLCQKVVPPLDMIELTMLQCIHRKKNLNHIIEVYNLVNKRINQQQRNNINQSILRNFFSFVKTNNIVTEKEVTNTLPLNDTSNIQRNKSIDSTESLENGNLPFASESKKIKTKSNKFETKSMTCNQPKNSPLEEGINTASTDYLDYNLKETGNVSERKSVYRDRFWKLYATVHCVNEGLGHADYAYVWKMLDDFSKENVTDDYLRRHYYRILCDNVRTCELHVTEVIKQAVRNGCSSRRSMDTLFDIGLHALVDLADNDLWVMAHQLLNSVKIIEPAEPRTDFILISAEIYIANNDPLEALYLLQKTKLIRTNRDEWLVTDSIKEHEKIRNKIVFILLQALSYKDQEKAVYLFKALMEDQYICYYPIDLPIYLDKLILLLLVYNKLELAIDICRLVMDKDLTFQKFTYSELINRLLPMDEILANQILEYAIQLGYYHDVQIKTGFTTIIIDTNYSEEEIYLILKRLFYKLNQNIGPFLERLTPNQLKVILVFEDIPDNERLYRNELALINVKDKYKNIKNLIQTVFLTRFSPPIRLSNRKMDKCCRLVSRTIVDYLKHWNL